MDPAEDSLTEATVAPGGKPEVPDPELPPGTMIGIYKVLGVLGTGGMGRVYLAVHSRLERPVALKVLRKRYAADWQTVRRFFDEARAVNRIRHENIVEVTDFLEEEETCTVMELLEGRSLTSVIRDGPIACRRALDIAAQVASALAAAHKAGIIHRDVKPSNIHVVDRRDRKDHVKLLDFGVAKLGAEVGGVFGTPAYMPPEQLSAGDVDGRADIFALGVTLYQMLAGRRPWEGKTAAQITVAHAREAPTPLAQAVPEGDELPLGLESLVHGCLSRDPAGRLTSMAQLEEQLVAMRDAMTAPPRAVGIPTDRVRIAAPRWRTPVLIVAALVGVAVMGALGWWQLGARGGEPELVEPTHKEPAAAVATTVNIGFTSVPDGAEVTQEGSDEVLGRTPVVLTLPQGPELRRFQFVLAGHDPVVREVTLDDGGTIEVRFPVATKASAAAVREEQSASKPEERRSRRRRKATAAKARGDDKATKTRKKTRRRKRRRPARSVILDPFEE